MENVLENTKIPQFHVENDSTWDGKQLKFRYWRLSRGNLTSSFTVLSDCHFVAVYDIVEEADLS